MVMASQTRTMAAWTLVAIVLCAQFEVGESVQECFFRIIKKAMSPKHVRPSTCDRECAWCGKHENPNESTILIATGYRLTEFTFGTLIGKRLALTNRKRFWSSIYHMKNYYVFLSSNGAFNYADFYRITAIERVMKNNGDGIVLLVLNKDIPGNIRPACLPTSQLTTIKGMKFDVPFYKTGIEIPESVIRSEYNFEVAKSTKYSHLFERCLPSALMNKELQLKGVARDKGRLTLDFPKASENKDRPFKVTTFGGSAILNVNDRHILYGMLKLRNIEDEAKFDLRIATIDDEDDGVVSWIHENAGQHCACEEPKVKLIHY